MENNNTVNFEEVIYSSSQKSIVSGMSGFGVRTHSADLSEDLIDILAKSGFFSYELSSDRMVEMKQLKNNPRIVYDYPETFIYKKISLENGIKKYIFSRTVYLGIDYGYFCGGDHCRTGSNYFSHILIFDKKPPKEIFNIIIDNNTYKNNVFLPLDYTCSPDNKELTALLTGEPYPLPSNSFNILQDRQIELNIADYMGLIITGVLQLYINSKVDSKNEKRLIIKTDKDTSKNILNVIKNFIPSTISSNLTFVTNHVREGMPDGFDIVFVNQFYNGTLYEDQHICVDLFNGNHTGTEQNFLFDKVFELVKSEDIETLKLLLDYVSEINIDYDSDFSFLYNIFILTKSDHELQLSDLTSEFINKLNKANLSESNKKIIWKKINSVINSKLNSINGKEIIDTLSLLTILQHNNIDEKINISEPTKEHFSKILFDSNQYFDRIVNSKNISVVAQITVPNIINNTDRLFGSLQTTDCKEAWCTFINICFPNTDKLTSNARLIITKIIYSQLPLTSQSELLLHLYPISDNGEQVFFNFFSTNINLICKHPEILFQICRKNPRTYYPELISKSINDQKIFEIVSTSFFELFNEKLTCKESTHLIVDDFLAIVSNLPQEAIEKLDIDNLMQTFIDSILDNPSKKYKSQIEELLNLQLKMKIDKKNQLLTIQSILNMEVPKTVNVKTMSFAYHLSMIDILKEMFNNWMRGGFSNKDLLHFIESAKGLSDNPQLITHMIESIWASTLKEIKSNKNILIETIIHNVKWNKHDYNKFIKSNEAEDLVTFITKSSSIFNKLFKKLFG